MADKKEHPLGFEIIDGVLHGSLKHGLKIGDATHKKFEMREATVDDLLDAELETDVTRPLAFSAALMVRQLIVVGSFSGPFSEQLIRRLKPADWRILRAAQSELDALGEAAPADAPAS